MKKSRLLPQVKNQDKYFPNPDKPRVIEASNNRLTLQPFKDD